MAKPISIECGKIRLNLQKAVSRIFDGGFANARIEDLPAVEEFKKHAEHCESCAALGKELGRALLVKLDARQ